MPEPTHTNRSVFPAEGFSLLICCRRRPLLPANRRGKHAANPKGGANQAMEEMMWTISWHCYVWPIEWGDDGATGEEKWERRDEEAELCAVLWGSCFFCLSLSLSLSRSVSDDAILCLSWQRRTAKRRRVSLPSSRESLGPEKKKSAALSSYCCGRTLSLSAKKQASRAAAGLWAGCGVWWCVVCGGGVVGVSPDTPTATPPPHTETTTTHTTPPRIVSKMSCVLPSQRPGERRKTGASRDFLHGRGPPNPGEDKGHPLRAPRRLSVVVCRFASTHTTPVEGKNLVDPASSHMLCSRAKPCTSQRKRSDSGSVNGSLHQQSST